MLLLVVSSTLACKGNSEFSSGSKTQKPRVKDSTPKPQPPVPVTPQVPQLPIPVVVPPTPTPPGSITKGSFTVWAVPANPDPGQDYVIHIKVQLPPNTTSYNYQDLDGNLIGTDTYTQEFGRSSPPGNDDRFKYFGTYAIAQISVPGAENLVRDTINVSSRLLNEAQQIVIIFGK